MIQPTPRSISMPPNRDNLGGRELGLRDRILVVIGANGSGKTRFGAWLEQKSVSSHHRVAAHRALTFPESSSPRPLVEAMHMLRVGREERDNDDVYRDIGRWGRSPEIALLQDFHLLVTALVSESFVVSDKYRIEMKAANEYEKPPETKLDVVVRIWQEILPNRFLIVDGCQINVSNASAGDRYHAKNMSDGERGIFYLIAEALCVPENGTFIVDEPELHIHKAIQSRLWDAIESARPDCTFVYITHDLEFAASRKEATKVWLREFTSDAWDWDVVPDIETFPESMLLEVMGSRRPILFVEGDKGSFDYLIYGKCFPEHTVVPCGSCDQVIHVTCSFKKMTDLHHITCSGLVDNDGRTEEEIEMLGRKGIAVLPCAIVENLFLLEPILAIAAAKLEHSSTSVVEKVKDRVFAKVKSNKERVVSNLTRMEIEAGLRTFGKGDDGAEALANAFNLASAAIDPTAIYVKWETEIDRVLSESDFHAALRYYKTKGLLSEAGGVLVTKYQDFVLRWLRGNDSAALVAALRGAIPEIPAAAL